MARNRVRAQRYKLIHEFVLSDRSDYARVTRRIGELLVQLSVEFEPYMLSDYVVVEKVTDAGEVISSLSVQNKDKILREDV